MQQAISVIEKIKMIFQTYFTPYIIICRTSTNYTKTIVIELVVTLTRRFYKSRADEREMWKPMRLTGNNGTSGRVWSTARIGSGPWSHRPVNFLQDFPTAAHCTLYTNTISYYYSVATVLTILSNAITRHARSNHVSITNILVVPGNVPFVVVHN